MTARFEVGFLVQGLGIHVNSRALSVQTG